VISLILVATLLITTAQAPPCEEAEREDGFALVLVESYRIEKNNAVYECTVFDADTDSILGAHEFWSPYQAPVLDTSVPGRDNTPGMTAEGRWILTDTHVHMPGYSFSTVGLVPGQSVLITYMDGDQGNLVIHEAYPVMREEYLPEGYPTRGRTQEWLQDMLFAVSYLGKYLRSGFQTSWDRELYLYKQIEGGRLLNDYIMHPETLERLRASVYAAKNKGQSLGEFKDKFSR
jgi:hypothetical protein